MHKVYLTAQHFTYNVISLTFYAVIMKCATIGWNTHPHQAANLISISDAYTDDDQLYWPCVHIQGLCFFVAFYLCTRFNFVIIVCMNELYEFGAICDKIVVTTYIKYIKVTIFSSHKWPL